MLAIRVLTMAAAVIFAASASAQTVIPYAVNGIGGPNNVYDIDETMCTQAATGVSGLGFSDPVGCIDRFFAACKSSPSSFCQVRSVPAGRCAAGASGCQWNLGQGVHFCTANTGIQCVTDDHCPSGDTCNTASGATPAQVALCACTSATEQTVCGPDNQARCSDGDPDLAFGEGHGSGLCSHSLVTGTESPTNCGIEASQPTTGPRSGWENPPAAITPQRNPGTGLSSSGEIKDLEGTYALVLGDADPNWGVRRYEVLGKSTWNDFAYLDKQVGGGSVNATIVPMAIDLPAGWETQQLLGTCTSGNIGALCRVSGDCAGGFGACTNFQGAWTYAENEVGFIFTKDVPASAPDTCPPTCGIDYDMHTYEQRQIEQVGVTQAEAGVQLAFDFLHGGPGAAEGDPNRQAGAGDAVGVTRVFVPVWLTDDPRCIIGGDPRRFDASACNSCPNAAAIGKCDDPGVSIPCDPANEGTNNDCAGLCRYCGGTHTSADATWGTAQALPAGYDNQAGNCEPGFDCSALDLVGRMGGINNLAYNLKVPLTVILTTGLVRAEMLDNTCVDPAGSCEIAGGGAAANVSEGTDAWNKATPGTRSYANGFAYPAYSAQFGSAAKFASIGATNTTGSAITWPPDDTDYVPGTGTETIDWGAGANGIPGCIGDNLNGLGSPPCDSGGGGRAPGTDDPGSDDVSIYSVDLDGDGTATGAMGVPRFGDPGTGATPIPNPNAGNDCSDLGSGPGCTPAAGAPGSLDDPNGAPMLRMVGGGSAIDLNVLLTNGNNDSLFKSQRVWCPVVTDPSDPNSTVKDCWYDADNDGINDRVDPCVTTDLTDADSDSVLDACDNCIGTFNPVVASPLAYQTTTGGQLDDDADGFGNHCDADFNNSLGLVNALDAGLFKGAFFKSAADPTACVGGPCDKYDLNGSGGLINALDAGTFKGLFFGVPGPKCADCPKACVGDACP